MEKILYCRDSLPENGNGLYHIVTRYSLIRESTEMHEPEYYVSAARYIGNGLWQEYDELYLRIEEAPAEPQGAVLPSEGLGKPELISGSGEGEESIHRIAEVIAYWSYPDLSVFLKR